SLARAREPLQDDSSALLIVPPDCVMPSCSNTWSSSSRTRSCFSEIWLAENSGNRSTVYYQPVPVSEEELKLMRLIDEECLSEPFSDRLSFQPGVGQSEEGPERVELMGHAFTRPTLHGPP